MKTRREWKTCAKQVLRGNYILPIFASVTITIINVIGSWITEMLFPGYSVGAVILSQIFAFILTLIVCVFSAGLYYMYLNIARKREYSFGNLIFFFKNQPDRVIVASFVMALIGWLTALPANVYIYTVNMGTTPEEQVMAMSNYLMLTALGLLLNVFLTVPFSLTYYLLADEEDLSGMEAMRESLRLMKGRIGKYILLELSFVPWFFVSIFTLYIALLWLIPYIQMTNVMFYRDIRGELNPPAPKIPVTPLFYGEKTEESAASEMKAVPEDDYNSEA